MAWFAGSIAWGVCLGLLVAGIRMTRLQRADLPFWLAAAGLFVLGLLVVLSPDRGYTFVVDDAYYYLQIARNIDVSGMVSFDGLHETNGFHPLWLCMLTVLHRLAPAGDEAFVTLAQLAALVLAAGVVVWLRTLLSPVAGPVARTVGLLVLFNPWALSRFWLSGMESAAAFLLLTAFLCGWRDLLERDDLGALGPLLRNCLLAGLVCLARIDLVVLVLPAFVLLVRAWVQRTAMCGRGHPTEVRDTGIRNERMVPGNPPDLPVVVRRLLAGGLAFSIPVGTWVVWNLARFGTASTVSSYVKTSLRPMSLAQRYDNFCLVLPSLKFLVDMPVLRVAAPIALLLAGLAVWRLGRRLASGPSRSLFFLLAVAAGVHYVLARGGVAESYSWYYLLETLLAVHVAAIATERLAAFGRGRMALAVLAGAVILSAGLVRDLLRDEPGWFVSRAIQREGRAAAEWLRDNTPPDAVVASWDAGILGYFAHRPVINLDGLVNDWDFVEVMRSGTYREYLEHSGVDYVANSFFVLEDGSLWHLRDGFEELLPLLKPVYRGADVPFLNVPVTVAVFRLLPARGR